LGRASSALGSDRSPWLYSATVGRGFEPGPEQRLMLQGLATGQFDAGQAQRQRLGVQAQYYLPQGRRWLFYAGASADRLTRPALPDTLLLGGDNGLRGYPLRYQGGTRRALFTVEERFYTDLYVWQLFRVGGAAFFDVGRAWGGDNVNAVNPGWLRNAGVGLRIVSVRSAFSNVLHVDLAFPIDATNDIKKVQFNVKTKTSF
jgi:outer membrane protein assembly factor BamA